MRISKRARAKVLRKRGVLCRVCGKKKLCTVLTYADNEGLCLQCWNKYKPLLLRK